MKKLIMVVLFVVATNIYGNIFGTILNYDTPWYIKDSDNNIYEVEWYGGDWASFYQYDFVILTETYGMGHMIKATDNEIVANVWVEPVKGITGYIINDDDDPWIVKSEDGNIYKAEWYGGSSVFYEGDKVLLTKEYGMGRMLKLSGTGRVAKVWIEEVK